MLAYLRDRSRQELSIRFGVPANTVKTHLRRALLELRATMFASVEARIAQARPEVALRDDRRLGACPGTNRQQQVMHTVALRLREAAGADIHLD